MAIGDRIKEARIKKGLTQEELGDIIGVTKSAVTNYEKHSRGLTSTMIIKLSKVLDAEPNYLFQDYFEPSDFYFNIVEKDIINDYKSLDNYGRKSVRDLLDNEKNRVIETRNNLKILHRLFYRDLDDFFEQNTAHATEYGLPDMPEFRSASAIIVMNDDSMTPIFQKGDLLLISRIDRISYDDIGLFKKAGSYFFRRRGIDELLASNKEYGPIPYDEDVICLGKIIRKF